MSWIADIHESSALDFTWAHQMELLRFLAHIFVHATRRGQDSMFVSTPALVCLKLLIFLKWALKWAFETLGSTTSFLAFGSVSKRSGHGRLPSRGTLSTHDRSVRTYEGMLKASITHHRELGKITLRDQNQPTQVGGKVKLSRCTLCDQILSCGGDFLTVGNRNNVRQVTTWQHFSDKQIQKTQWTQPNAESVEGKEASCARTTLVWCDSPRTQLVQMQRGEDICIVDGHNSSESDRNVDKERHSQSQTDIGPSD